MGLQVFAVLYFSCDSESQMRYIDRHVTSYNKTANIIYQFSQIDRAKFASSDDDREELHHCARKRSSGTVEIRLQQSVSRQKQFERSTSQYCYYRCGKCRTDIKVSPRQ